MEKPIEAVRRPFELSRAVRMKRSTAFLVETGDPSHVQTAFHPRAFQVPGPIVASQPYG